MRYYRSALCFLLLATISGCADSVTSAEAASRETGDFWEGVLVGFLIGVVVSRWAGKSAFIAKQNRAARDAEFLAEMGEIRADLAKRTEHPPREWKPSSEEPPKEDTQNSEPEQAGS